jgi:chemotaxis protein MotB
MKFKILVAVFSIFLVSSCVSTQKYADLENQHLHTQAELDKFKKRKTEDDKTIANLKSEIQNFKDANSAFQELIRKHDDLLEDKSDLEKKYDEQIKAYSELVNITSSEKQQLNELIAESQKLLDKSQTKLWDTEMELDKRESQIEAMSGQIEEKQIKIAELFSNLNQMQFRMSEIKNTINNALIGFSAEDVSIEEKSGKVYISVSQKLLFKKGSNEIDAGGVKVLEKLSSVLKQNHDLDIIVEGHTDDDGTSAFNWDLSTLRATTVVKLLEKFGVDPTRLTAAGRAFYAPVADNTNAEGHALNRRTDIVLSPKLHELLEIIK